MKITIQATRLELSPEEVKQHLSPEQLQQVKGKVLTPYTIAEEGQSRPRVIGEGSRVLNWTRGAIKSVAAKLAPKTKLFPSHNEDNSTTNRKSVGEVVTSFVKEIGGKLRTIAVACLDSNINGDYDVCSIEARVYEQNSIVSGVDTVTAIAVANSRVEKPAFDNAKRMATIQCFGLEEPNPPERKTMPTYEELLTTPLSDIQRLIKDRQIWAGQLYEPKDLENDKVFGKIFKENEDVKAQLTEATTKVKTLEENQQKAEKDLLKSSAKDVILKALPEGTTQGQKSFVEHRLDVDKLGSLDETKVKDYIDSELKEYPAYVKMISGKEEETQIDKGTNPTGEAGETTAQEVSDAFDAE